MSEHSCKLSELLDLERDASTDVIVSGLALDSRKVVQGDLFFACVGHASDGRDYIRQALNAGAVAVVYESGDGFEPDFDLPVFAIGVSDLSQQVGYFASRFYGEPSDQMQIFGVTGTNGKTSCCYLLAQALEKLGMPCAMIGTLGVGLLDELNDSGHTTPDVITVHRLLAEWLERGVYHVCMEVSSHALDQGRVNGVTFFCTLFTNFSQDHLDYHGDMQSYRKAKERLFVDFQTELVVTNADDELGAALIDIAKADFITSYGNGGDLEIDQVISGDAGLNLVLASANDDLEVQSQLVGAINAPNIALVCVTLLALGIEQEQVTDIVAGLKAAPGRMQLIAASGKPRVVVDYAHTPDALQKALESLGLHCEGDLWCVFGCGGDRDKLKRPLMGKIAATFADQIVITDDNPRSEAAESIVDDIRSGIDSEVIKSIQVIHDRKQAIKFAIEHAKQNDWILLAGKGHETGQIFADQVLSFSDIEVTESLLGVAV
jgi:UDP-N-acetylmuramoyl-L-alanyl-D-glutamate--2,6-diaminopimelate ligase